MIWCLFCSIATVWVLALFGFGLFISIRVFRRLLRSLNSTSHVELEKEVPATSNNYAIVTKGQASTVW
jgi:hypothetical protein